MCPMPTTPRAYVAAIAACLVMAVLPDAADARGGGHAGMGNHMGMSASHALGAAHADAPRGGAGGKQTAPQPPSQSQTAAAAAAAAAATQNTSIPTTALPPSAIATPAPQTTAVAPLSPPPAQTIEFERRPGADRSHGFGGGFEREPQRIGAQCTGRRRRHPASLHGLLGPRHAYEQGRMARGLHAHAEPAGPAHARALS